MDDTAPPLELPAGLDPLDVDAVVAWAVARFGPRLVLATSLGVEDMIVLDAVSRASGSLPASARPRAFLLETGRLHESTLRFFDAIRERFAVPVDVFVPESAGVQRLVRTQGAYGFRLSLEARKECCAVRKLEPLGRALAGAEAWMTGLRRVQSPTRSAVEILEPDPGRAGVWKINPLAHWDDARTWAYARAHAIPVHPLHADGYPSIGCEPCTRAVSEGEDPRAGRWWWESADHKECGLHAGPSSGRQG